MTTSERFKAWFEAQAGKRSSRKPTHVLWRQYIDLKMRESQAKQVHDDVMEWESERTIAYQAWLAASDGPARKGKGRKR